MKKLLTSTAVIAAVAAISGSFVACGEKNGNNDAETAQAAITAIRTLYAGKSAETPEDYTVIGTQKVGSKAYNIKWTVNSEFANFAEYVKVGEMNDKNQVPITIKKATEEIEYTLKATVNVGKASASEEFKRKVPATQAQEGEVEANINFTASENNTSISATEQLWEQNGIKITNTKGDSVTNCNNYDPSTAGHARFYKTSDMKIEYPGMKKLVFTTTGYDYPTALKTVLDNTGLGTATIAEKAEGQTYATDVSFVLVAPTDVLEFTLTADQVRLTSLLVVANEAGATDADKVTCAKAALNITDSYTATGEYDLPAEKLGVAVKWSVKDAPNAYVEITTAGKLNVKEMPETETPVTLVAELALNDAKGSKEIEIKLVPLGLTNDGTEAHPYTPTEAKKVTALLASGATSAQEVYVKGYVVAPGTFKDEYNNFENMYIADTYEVGKDSTAADAFYVYRPKTTDAGTLLTAEGLKKGDLVTFKGKLQNYQGKTPELVNGILTAREAAEKTDDDIVKEALADVKLDVTKYTALNTEGVTLPATEGEATLKWALKEASSEYVSVEGGKLKINKLPTTGEVEVKLTVTASYGEATDQSKDVTITVAAPKTIEAGTYNLVLDLTGVTSVTGIAKKYYFTGSKDGNFGATSDNVANAAAVEIAASGEGYTLKIGEQYIEVVSTTSGTKTYYNFGLVGSSTGVWKLDQILDVLTFTVGSNNYYLGTYLNGDSTRTTISASATSYISGDNAANVGVTQFPVTLEKVVTVDPSASDDEKIAAALENVANLINASYGEGEVQLPSTHTATGATLKWEVVDGKGVVTIDASNKMTVSNPESADVTGVTVKVTVSCGAGTARSKDNITFTVTYEAPDTTNYGTIDAPLSVTAALAIAEAQCTVTGEFTKQVVYMTGTVSTAPSGKNLYVTDGTKTILVYGSSQKSGIVAPAQNDVLIISGYITCFKYNDPGKPASQGTIEFSYNNNTSVYVEQNTRGNSTITLGDHDGATVDGLPTEATANGTTVTFTVAENSGKKITAVKVGSTVLTAVESNSYSFTVEGNMTVTVETKDEGAQDPVILKTITFNSTNNSKGVTAYNTTFDATQDGLSWKVDCFNNNNNGWNYIKTGNKNNAIVGMITTKSAVASTVQKVVVTIDAVTADKVNSFKLLISDNADFTDAVEVTMTIAQGEITFNVPAAAVGANKYYRIAIDCQKSSNGIVQLSKVELWGFEATASTPETDSDEAQTPAPEAILNDEQ